jgi:hypothetical protein
VIPAALCAWLAATPQPVDSQSDRPHGHALVIGVDLGASQDALDFAKFAEDTLGIPDANVALLTGGDATGAAISQAMDALLPPAGRAAGDSLWVYFAGTIREDGRFLGSDGAPGTQPLKDVFARLARTPAEERVVLLDALPSGHALPKAPPGVVFFSGAAGDGRKGRTEGRGTFTRQLLFGLRGAADVDADGDVTFGELGAYVRRKLESLNLAPLLQVGTAGARVVVESPEPEADEPGPAPLVILRDAPDTGENGRLFVESSVPGFIAVDGKSTGQSTPATLEEVPVGHHRIDVASTEGRGSATTEIVAGVLSSVHVDVAKRARVALVRIETQPADASVTVDAKTPLHSPVAVPLAPGRHALHVELSGFQTVDQTLVVDDKTDTQVVRMKPADSSYVLSLLSPLVEYDVRYEGDVWFGGRLNALFAGYDPGNGAWNALFVGFAAVAHYRLEDPATSGLGMDLYGGPTLEYVQYTPNGGGFAHTDSLIGAVAGVALRFGYFQLMVETHGGIVGGEVHLFVCPLIAIRLDR